MVFLDCNPVGSPRDCLLIWTLKNDCRLVSVAVSGNHPQFFFNLWNHLFMQIYARQVNEYSPVTKMQTFSSSWLVKRRGMESESRWGRSRPRWVSGTTRAADERTMLAGCWCTAGENKTTNCLSKMMQQEVAKWCVCWNQVYRVGGTYANCSCKAQNLRSTSQSTKHTVHVDMENIKQSSGFILDYSVSIIPHHHQRGGWTS